MKRIGALLPTIFLTLALAASCGGGEEQAGEASEEENIGGYAIVDPDGEEVYIPSAIAEREAVENYLQDVRPVITDTARDFSRFVTPSTELQDQTLTFSVEVESIQQADQALEQGLEALQALQPPEGLEPIHESLVAAYEEALPAYDDILETFNSGDLNQLTKALGEGLPEIQRFNTEARAILQELERVETVNPNDQAESR